MNNSKPKIVIFGDDPTGPTGFGKVVRHLALAVQSVGCEPIVVGLKQHFGEAETGFRILNALHRNDPRGFDTLNLLLKSEEIPMVITVGDPWDIQGLPQIKEQTPFRWIAYTPVDSTPYPRYVLFAKDPHQYLDVAFLLGQADHLVTFSSFGKSALEQMLSDVPFEEEHRPGSNDTDANAIDMIYLGVDPCTFYPRDDSEFRKQLLRNHSEEILLFTCMKVNSIRAGFDSLFEAWSLYLKLARQNDAGLAQSSRLYLHTSLQGGAYPIQLLIQRYGVEDSVFIDAGIQQQNQLSDESIADIHSASDIVLSTVRGEGFGLQILEAMSCGVPCLVPDYGCPAEYGGDAAIRIPIAASFNPEFATTDFKIVDVNAMAKSMLDLAIDKQRRKQMAIEARKIAESMSWDRFVDSWSAKLSKLMD